MDGAFDLTAVWGRATFGFGVVGTVYLRDHPIFVLYDIGATDDVPVTQPHFPTGDEPAEPLRGVLLEVVAFDEKFPRERYQT